MDIEAQQQRGKKCLWASNKFMEFWNILTANVSEYSNSNCFAFWNILTADVFFWNILTASWLLYLLFISDPYFLN